MRRTFVAAAVAALVTTLVVLQGCPETRSEAECNEACTVLDTCGLLPSALGASLPEEEVGQLANCVARCVRSPDETVVKIADCTERLGTPDAAVRKCDVGCERVATCLRAQHPNDPVTGHAALRVLPVKADESGTLGSAAILSCVGPLCKDDAGCRSGRGKELDGDEAKSWCTGISASSARAFAIQNNVYSWSDSVKCEQLVTNGAAFETLFPGRTRVGLEIRRAITNDAGPDGGVVSRTLFCHILYGAEVALTASTRETAFVSVPSELTSNEFECEEGPLCGDTFDNDGNQFVDCQDPRCEGNPACATDAGPLADGSTPPTDAGADADAGPSVDDASTDAP